MAEALLNFDISSEEVGDVGRGDRLTSTEAEEVWRKIFESVQIQEPGLRTELRTKLLTHFLLNSTSPTGHTNISVIVGGRAVQLITLFGDHTIPGSQVRRWMRADSNIRMLQDLATKSAAVKAEMRKRAAQKGIPGDCYRAVCDVAEFFGNLTDDERYYSMRAKEAALRGVNQAVEGIHDPGFVSAAMRHAEAPPNAHAPGGRDSSGGYI